MVQIKLTLGSGEFGWRTRGNITSVLTSVGGGYGGSRERLKVG